MGQTHKPMSTDQASALTSYFDHYVADDFFMPSQFAAMRAPSHWSGERKLMFSILTGALRELHAKNKRIAYEARLWFESDDNYLFSFRNIASCLGLSERECAEILAGRISLRKHRNRVPVRAA